MFNYFFKKKLRLSDSINFKHVFDKPIKKKSLEISVLGRLNLLDYPRLGLIISRKNIKYAHNRNLIKRLVRETFRLLQHKLIAMDFVVIAQKNIVFLNNIKIINMLKNLWSNYYQ